MNKGDKVRVVGNTSLHMFNVGDIVTCRSVDSDYMPSFTNGADWSYMFSDDYVDVTDPATLQVGETYTSIGGYEWDCIAVKGDVAWLSIACKDITNNAYPFKLDGTPIHLKYHGDKYRIKFPPTIKQQQYDVIVDGVAVAINYKTVDGVPDFTDATVVPF